MLEVNTFQRTISKPQGQARTSLDRPRSFMEASLSSRKQRIGEPRALAIRVQVITRLSRVMMLELQEARGHFSPPLVLVRIGSRLVIVLAQVQASTRIRPCVSLLLAVRLSSSIKVQNGPRLPILFQDLVTTRSIKRLLSLIPHQLRLVLPRETLTR